MSVGTILMTIDPPLVLCWTLALVAGWRAVQADGTTHIGCGLAWLPAWAFSASTARPTHRLLGAVLPALAPGARALKKPGPYLALLIFALCTLPVLIWNAQHGWITDRHVADDAGMSLPWQPTLRFFWEFTAMKRAC